MGITVETTVDKSLAQDLSQLSKISHDALPLVCFRDGNLPLPDLPDKNANSVIKTVSNASISEIQGIQNTELCYPMQKKLKVTLTNEQIYPGVWYLGLFNGIGDTRTQSKMINRGDKFSYSANVSVTGCTFPNLWGQNCNQTVESLTCAKSLMNGSMSCNSNQTAIQKISCRNSVEQTCLASTAQKMYFTEIIGLAEKLIISADVSHSGTLKACARYGSPPSLITHDYTISLDKGTLIIQSPKVGGWYTVMTPFESYYLPIFEVSLNSERFVLEPLLSNSSMGNQSGIAWTYFTMNVPQGATARNMHVRLLSKKETRYEIYARYGGLPPDQVWDYFYASKTNSSEGAKFFMMNNSTKEIVDFYMLYIREGTWNFAIKHPDFNDVALATVLVKGHMADLIAAPKLCLIKDMCGNRLVSLHQMLLPYFRLIMLLDRRGWACTKSAPGYAEWVIYTCSGISSGLFHKISSFQSVEEIEDIVRITITYLTFGFSTKPIFAGLTIKCEVKCHLLLLS